MLADAVSFTILFFDFTKIISFFAKKARGAMVRYIITNSISDIDGIISFNLDNYSYDESLSSRYKPVFIR